MSTTPKSNVGEMLKEQYKQCHDHLRASDQKRDVILGIYTTLSVAFFGFTARFSDTGQQVSETINLILSKEAFFIAVVVLILTGILLGALFTLYRGWHGLYIIQAIALQHISQTDIPRVNKDLIRAVIFRFNNIVSVELLMFAILHSVLAFHFWSAFAMVNVAWVGSCWPRIIVWTLLILICFETCGHFVAMCVLDRFKETGRLGAKYLWLLQGLFENEQ